MPQIETVFFGYDDTLIDSEVIYSCAYITMFREFGIHVGLEEIFTRFRSVELYGAVDIISKERGVMMVQVGAEYVYRAEVVRLFDTEFEDIAGTSELLVSINVSMCVISNDPVGRVQHSLGKLNMLRYLPEKLFSSYDTQRWKPDPVLIFHATRVMNVDVEDYILVDDPDAGAQSGINIGMEVSYFYADPYNKPIIHLKVTTFTHLSQLPELWKTRGWGITAQLFTLPSLTPLKSARKGK